MNEIASSSGKTNLQQQSGVALLLVIFVITLASVIVINLAYSTHLSARTNALVNKSLQAEYLLKSALNFARVLIQADTSPEDAPKDPWGHFINGGAIPPELLNINEPNLRIELEIRPQNNGLMLRQLAHVGQGSMSPDRLKWCQAFQRLFINLGFQEDEEVDHTGLFQSKIFRPKEMVGALIDYMDPDTESFQENDCARGIEKDLPKDNEFPGTPPSTLEELRGIPGFTPNRLRKLMPLISLEAGKVNINTAPLEVLKALDEDIIDEIAQDIIAERNKEPFTANDWQQRLEDIIGGSEAAARISSLTDVGSRQFQVLAKVDYGGNFRYFLRASVLKNQGLETDLPAVSWIELF